MKTRDNFVVWLEQAVNRYGGWLALLYATLSITSCLVTPAYSEQSYEDYRACESTPYQEQHQERNRRSSLDSENLS